MVIKDNFIKIIEFNINKIPLKTFQEYMGSCNNEASSRRLSGTSRKEKCLTYN